MFVLSLQQKMVKFFKREEKERSKLQGGYNTVSVSCDLVCY